MKVVIERGEYKGIIYKAVSPTGKVYIGQTTQTLKRRKGQHSYRSKKGDRREVFQLAILEHGGVNAFTWEEIDHADTAEELDQKEKQWITHYQSDDPQYGYNTFEGGIGSGHTAETRRKIGEANKGKQRSPEARQKYSEYQKNRTPEHRRKISQAKKGNKYFLGKHHTEESRRKMSEAKRDFQFTEEHRRKLSEAQKRRRARETSENSN